MKSVERKVGKALVRVLPQKAGFAGVVIFDGKVAARRESGDVDELWHELLGDAAKLDPSYFGFDGARIRFRRMMAEGFADKRYLEWERSYKLRAKAKLEAALPLEAARDWSGDGEGALAAYRATNLLSPFESTRMQAALRSPAAAPFIRGAAMFADGETDRGLREMEQALKPFDVAKWTALTYLPFLWRPDTHMFLKPEVTRDFATRVGHGFADAYSPELKSSVYRSLIDLVEQTERETMDLAPVDRIDIQSFIWIVGKYTDEDEAQLKEWATGWQSAPGCGEDATEQRTSETAANPIS